MVFSSGGVPQL